MKIAVKLVPISEPNADGVWKEMEVSDDMYLLTQSHDHLSELTKADGFFVPDWRHLKGGEEVRNGLFWGWTGQRCGFFQGHGQGVNSAGEECGCPDCGGTGEEWDLMPGQLATAASAIRNYVKARTQGVRSQHKLPTLDEILATETAKMVCVYVMTPEGLPGLIEKMVEAGTLIKTGPYYSTKVINTL